MSSTVALFVPTKLPC